MTAPQTALEPTQVKVVEPRPWQNASTNFPMKLHIAPTRFLKGMGSFSVTNSRIGLRRNQNCFTRCTFEWQKKMES